MDKENSGSQGEAPSVHSEIAEIESQADMLARKNETPQQVAEVQQEYQEQREAQSQGALALNKPKKFHIKLNKWVYIGVSVFIALLLVAWFLPFTRYAALSMVGAKGRLTVSASQAQTQAVAAQTQLKNFSVEVDGKRYASDDASDITINDISYGSHSVVVKKQGYDTINYQHTVDFDPLFGLFNKQSVAPPVRAQLIARGLPVSFSAKDWTGDLSLIKGDFTYGDITAQPNKDGLVTLVVVPPESEKVTIKADFSDNYLDKSFEIEVNKKDQVVSFVPDTKHYFVSKRSGVYSVYGQYIDGSELKEVVKGTPQETSSLQFAASPSGKYGVMASTREGRRDASGNVVQKLYWVNLSSGKLEELDSARYIYLHDWTGDTITYSYSYQGENNEFLQRLRSVDTATKNQYKLSETTGYYGRIHVAQGQVIFTKQESYNKPGFEKDQTVNTVGIKGESIRELATNIADFRQIGFEKFTYQTPDKKWSEINLNTGQIKPSEQPREEGTVYISTSSSKNERVFINFVDGKRILMLQKTVDNTNELASQAGMTGPIRFMNATTVIYRVVTPQETADYAVSTLGGKPRKITDVTASAYATPVFFQYY